MPQTDDGVVVCVGCKPGKDKPIRMKFWPGHQRFHERSQRNSRREALRHRELRMATADTKVIIRTPEALGDDTETIAVLLSRRKWTLARVLGAAISGAMLAFFVAYWFLGLFQ